MWEHHRRVEVEAQKGWHVHVCMYNFSISILSNSDGLQI